MQQFPKVQILTVLRFLLELQKMMDTGEPIPITLKV